VLVVEQYEKPLGSYLHSVQNTRRALEFHGMAPAPRPAGAAAAGGGVMADLSPAAQAVMKAYWKSPWDPSLQQEDRYAIAAALRAAAEQLGYHIVYDDGEPDYRVDVADLHAIAAELEQAANNNNTTETTP
jgi:hypothetical protein